MSRIEEIERAAEKLPLTEFVKLAAWFELRLQQLDPASSRLAKDQKAVRDHGAFLNSYSPGDEGLYDDATAR